MKVLFVCAQNVARSQAAAALYNKYHPGSHASSAGTNVEKPGETIAERAQYMDSAGYMMDCLTDEGMDISHNVRTSVTPEMLGSYDQIINMAQPELAPSWLKDDQRVEYWEVPDPKGKGRDDVKHVYEQVKKLVIERFGDGS